MIETWFSQDIRKPVKVQYLDGNIFSQDNNGNTIGVSVYNNGQGLPMTGSVSGSIIRSDGVTVSVGGTLNNNKASIVLPQAAYVVPGLISIVIKLTNGTEITTLCAVVANVYRTSTDSIVDPGTIIPSIDALIAEIEIAVASIPADYSTLNEIAAPVPELIKNDYRNVTMPINATVSGWRLVSETGLCVSNSSYKLLKYKVTAGTLYHIVSDDLFQFQNSASVPSSGTNNRIGSTYANGEFYFIAPYGATYLIISTPASGSTAYCERCDYINEYETLNYKIDGRIEPALQFVQELISGETGQPGNDTTQIHSQFVYVGKGNAVRFTVNSGYTAYMRWYDSADYSSYVSGENGVTGLKTAPADYLIVGVTRSDYTTITPASGSNVSVVLLGNHPTIEPYIFSVVESADEYNINKYVCVDLVNKTIKFSDSTAGGRTYIRFGNNQIEVTGKTADLSLSTDGYVFLYYQISTNEFVVNGSATTTIRTKSNDYVYVGAFLSGQKTVNLKVYPFYFVNGAMATCEDDRNNFDGPKAYRSTQNIAVLGDSTSTYLGISETEIGGREVRGAYYPAGDVDDSSLMWWAMLRNMLRMGGGISVSAISRSGYRADIDSGGIYAPAVWNSERISNLSANGAPHYIFVNVGINDGYTAVSNVGSFSYEHDVNTIESEAVTIARGIELTIRKIQNANPFGRIVLIIPLTVAFNTTSYNFKTYYKMCELIKQIGESYGVARIIDLRKCGIHNGNYTYYLRDGTHPNKYGMEKIAKYIYYCLTGSEKIVEIDTD